MYQILHPIPFGHKLIFLLISFCLSIAKHKLTILSAFDPPVYAMLDYIANVPREPTTHLYSCTSLAHLEALPHITAV